jgi:osmotically-inducible protein OsmY
MKQRVIAASLALFLAAAVGPVSAAGPYAPDNTGTNARDRGGDTLTAADQPQSGGDLQITQQVRKALVADKSLSVNAHNVKVVTTGGVVTLRGPVKSAQEKMKLASTVARVAGVKGVDNQLEIVSQ